MDGNTSSTSIFIKGKPTPIQAILLLGNQHQLCFQSCALDYVITSAKDNQKPKIHEGLL
jgi:hypothetical protein